MTGTVALSMMDYGGPPFNSSWLIGRFRHRAAAAPSGFDEYARGAKRDESWLNHFGAVVVNPLNVLGVMDHWSRSRPGAVDVETPWELLRVNHYVDAFQPRCYQKFLPCQVPD